MSQTIIQGIGALTALVTAVTVLLRQIRGVKRDVAQVQDLVNGLHSRTVARVQQLDRVLRDHGIDPPPHPTTRRKP